MRLGLELDQRSIRAMAVKTKAEQGDADAQYNLGAMYLTGEGVAQDKTEAVKRLNSTLSSRPVPLFPRSRNHNVQGGVTV